MKEKNKVRVRFAPSPTGYFHVGSARAALFNFLYAKKNKGTFILRIEDTDRERFDKRYEEDIMRSLEWLGLVWDEGPSPEGEKGSFGPYYQTERKDIYKKYLLKLLEEEKAYYCFCSKEKLEEARKKQKERKEPPRYEGNCFSLSKEERERLKKEGREFTVRLHLPENEEVVFNDLIRKKVKFNTKDIGGDFVVAKQDLSPLYNFACVVDDQEMQITHVIRGEDHISNTPKQILLQKALGFTVPEFAHLPLILGPDKSKLSKRHGTVSLYEYKEKGYLPEALVNFIALLGWNPGTDEEIFTLEEIVKNFSLEDCQKSGAVFNEDKLNYINGHYIRRMDLSKLTNDCLPYLLKEGLLQADFEETQYPPAYGGKEPSFIYYAPMKKEKISFEKLKEIISLYQERMKILSEVGELTDYFFKDTLDYEKDLLFFKDATEEEIEESLDKAIKTLSSIKNWEKEEIERILIEEANRARNRGVFLWPLRVALSGKKASASPFDIVYVLGPKEALTRLKTAKNKLK